ncbi:MAG TPA: flagellar assembly protein A [Burkholderiaceae bacterium]|jgi:hypothetical protein
MAQIPTDGEGRRLNPLADATPVVAQPQEFVALPIFILRLRDGIHVALPALDTTASFANFVDAVFASGFYFANLDYACFEKILYELGIEERVKLIRNLEEAGREPMLRLADAILPFARERRPYYGEPALDDNHDIANYRFKPIPGTEHPDDGAHITVHSWQAPEPAQLNVDEFVAAMWCHNVRYGIDVALVKRKLRSREEETAEIAQKLPPIPGRDARVVELADTLHRSNAPKVLPDGRVDLLQFQNRFPHVEKETKLVRKVPRMAGKPGRDLTGQELVPEPPKDLDLHSIAGLGTRIDNTPEGEILVANIGGFLQIDAHTRIITISEKIVNHEGVSLRTTGNLVLPGDHYEEHGVVQERAQVEGKHMMYMADVFGNIVSRGGMVVLKKNLVGGSIRDAGGTIMIEGKASRSALEAPDGEIRLHYAENCKIVAARVHITQAVHCDILAREISIESAEGCAMAAQTVQLVHATSRHDIETTISMLIPNLGALNRELEVARGQQLACENVIKVRRAEAEKMADQPEIKSYLVLSAKVRAKAVHMTDEQAANWDRLQRRLAPQVRRLTSLNEDLQAASSAHADCLRQVQAAELKLQQASGDISCQIAEISGETVIRTMNMLPDQASPESLGTRDLRTRLRGAGSDGKVLYHGGEGDFFWSLPQR